MTDFVSREEVLQILSGNTPWESYKKVKDLPAVDIRPIKHGKWNRTDAYPHRIYCSACHKTYLQNDEWLEKWDFPMDYCPNCGADMREEEK